MKILRLIFCFGVMVVVASILLAEHKSSRTIIAPDRPFDNYGNICWEYEKARLDNFAVALSEDSDWVGYIIVYAGKRSCAGEAETRALRAMKWVVEKRGINPNKVRWKDGGYREEATTTLLIAPPEITGLPIAPMLEPTEVKVLQHCKGKIYKPKKCEVE